MALHPAIGHGASDYAPEDRALAKLSCVDEKILFWHKPRNITKLLAIVFDIAPFPDRLIGQQ
jgi:hypothetical protein